MTRRSSRHLKENKNAWHSMLVVRNKFSSKKRKHRGCVVIYVFLSACGGCCTSASYRSEALSERALRRQQRRLLFGAGERLLRRCRTRRHDGKLRGLGRRSHADRQRFLLLWLRRRQRSARLQCEESCKCGQGRLYVVLPLAAVRSQLYQSRYQQTKRSCR